MDYKKAGVNIATADAFVKRIVPLCRGTETAAHKALAAENGFAALMRVPRSYTDPVLVSSTDGVGTKLKLAFAARRHDTVGRDLVAMCVNDILVYGAEPLLFLDYFACGRLRPDVGIEVVKGIAEGCREASCALLGGETAEMPDMYAADEYDIAGFAVGVVEEKRRLGAHRVVAGDVVVGAASSGVHANGFSLVRRIVEEVGLAWDDPAPWDGGGSLVDRLLAPTRIYVRPVLELYRRGGLHAAAHITGGGLAGNLPRVLGEGRQARIRTRAWRRPAVFDWLQKTGGVDEAEMRRVFNCGIGMALVMPEEQVEESIAVLKGPGIDAWVIGRVEAGCNGVVYEEDEHARAGPE